jgi:hypothetical protein
MASMWTLGQKGLLLGGLLALAGTLRADGLPDLPPLPGAPAAAPAQPNPWGASVAPQASQEDLAKLQARIKELSDQAAAISDGQSHLQTLMDRLLTATGVRFGGEAVMDSDNLLALTPTQAAQRLWPTVGYFDFSITARPRPELQATVVYRMEKIFGEFWGSGDISGVKWFNIHGDTPIGFDLGQFHYQDTPLTFWLPKDPYEFEPELLARKRALVEQEVNIDEVGLPLEGGLLNGTVVFGGHLDMELEALGIRTAIAGNKNTSMTFGVTYPYDQYYVGGTVHFTGEKSKVLRAGLSYFELKESVDTNQSVELNPPQSNSVVGADVRLSLFGDKLQVSAEGASSSYTPSFGVPGADWTKGTAALGRVDLVTEHHQLHLSGGSVDQGFINYAAQTRSEDDMRDPLEDLPTGNNLYNPRTGGWGIPTVTNLYFAEANNVIFATNQGPKNGLMLLNGAQPSGIYLTHGFFNQSLPEGLATPNRAGFGGSYTGSFFKGLIQPTVLGSLYNEAKVDYFAASDAGTATFTRGGGGLKLDFGAIGKLPLTLSAGVVAEDTRSAKYVAFDSTRIGYDASYKLTKAFKLLAGFEHWDCNGGVYMDMGDGNGVVWTYANFLVDDYVGGFDWAVSKSTDAFLSYSFIDIDRPDNVATNAQAQEWQAKVSMRF